MDKMDKRIQIFNSGFKSIKNKMDILELQNILSELKKALYSLNTKLETKENYISEFEDKSIEKYLNESAKRKPHKKKFTLRMEPN